MSICFSRKSSYKISVMQILPNADMLLDYLIPSMSNCHRTRMVKDIGRSISLFSLLTEYWNMDDIVNVQG